MSNELKAVTAALALWASPATADVDDKRCILLAAAKLPAIADLRLVSTASLVAKRETAGTARLAQQRIDTIKGSSSAAVRVVTAYRSLNDSEAASIAAANGDSPRLKAIVESLLAQWSSEKLVVVTRLIELRAELADQKVKFNAICTITETGSAEVSTPSVVE
ncbi:hypothetical protein [Hansschlegelia sp.]|uniref:hypothetical protein n=1 Tax=Hansschlegelia sp. TaxID=2041892 RepID=UPI002C5093A3|nr:hypothetical protein [Hansschlegelia sp.]HVI28863.1 hypothetical protein [Hansschlegelia sp.]